MTLPTSIPAHIRQESIASHESAIDKIMDEIEYLTQSHKVGTAVIDRQINQLLTAYRCLVLELKEMQNEVKH